MLDCCLKILVNISWQTVKIISVTIIIFNKPFFIIFILFPSYVFTLSTSDVCQLKRRQKNNKSGTYSQNNEYSPLCKSNNNQKARFCFYFKIYYKLKKLNTYRSLESVTNPYFTQDSYSETSKNVSTIWGSFQYIYGVSSSQISSHQVKIINSAYTSLNNLSLTVHVFHEVEQLQNTSSL